MVILEEYFITEDSSTPLCVQFDSFIDNITYALKDPEPSVRLAVKRLEPLGKDHFLLNREEFMKEHGPELECRGEEGKEFLRQCYTSAMIQGMRSYNKYESDLKRLFYVIRGHLD